MFRATKIQGYLKAMEQLGISGKQLLAGSGINAGSISSAAGLVSLEQYYAVVANMIRLTDNPGIAFSLGRLSGLGNFGIVGYAMVSANSLREATDVWIKYSCSLVGLPVKTDWYQVVSGHELTFSSLSNVDAIRRFETEEIIVQGINVVRDLTGVEPVFRKVAFAYSAPRHRALYEECLNCPLEFDAEQTVVTMSQPDFDAPVRTTNEEVFNICAEHCTAVMSSLADGGLWRSRLLGLFLATPGRLPTLEAASAALGVSASTLGRQLEEAGQSYQGIKDEFRHDLAREYLRTGHLSPKQVGYLLGFASPSTFSRAFKSWSGQTVGQFLKSVPPAP